MITIIMASERNLMVNNGVVYVQRKDAQKSLKDVVTALVIFH